MEEPYLTTIFKKNPLFTWSSDWEEVCKSSSKLWLERPSLLTLSHQTPLRMSRPRSKIRKESLPINKDSSSLENNLKTEELFPTTTSRKNQPSTWSSDSEVECKSSWKHSQERPSPSTLNHQTPLKTSRPRSKIRKVSPPINKDSSLQENNLRMAEHFLTTTSKRSQPCTWSSDWEEDNEIEKTQRTPPPLILLYNSLKT